MTELDVLDLWFTATSGKLSLNIGDVHIWRISLKGLPGKLSALLSEDERVRAARFHFDRDRNQFIIAHGALRAILARYLTLPPEELCFEYNNFGKPSLSNPPAAFPLQFNLSHTHQLALVAITLERAVGVDVEWAKSEFSDTEIARRFFSTTEFAALQALPAEERRQAFYDCWTRKEAYLKARGEGLSQPLDAFDVSLRPGEPAVLLATRPDPAEAKRWSLHALSPGPGYFASLAVKGVARSIHCWQWGEM